MAKKTGGAGKKKNENQNPPLKLQLKKTFFGIMILLFIVFSAGFGARYFFIHHFEKKTASVKPEASVKTPVIKVKKHKIPAYEVYPTDEKHPVVTPDKIPLPENQLPKVAIIIDDIGYDKKVTEKLLTLDATITFSILPHSPYQKKFAKKARKKGFEVMLHLPMEPLEYPKVKPGPGALLTSMDPDKLIKTLNDDLKQVPYVKGVNNHMGSKLTGSADQMNQIFTIMKKNDLFFIDSRTAPHTLCEPSARLFQVPFAQRDVFLDHFQSSQAVRRQIKKLIQIAQHNGFAVGIGHPHSITYEVLKEELPDIKQKVRLVPASNLVRIIS